MSPNLLMAASAGLVGLLGLAHLVLTYRGPKLLPRDRDLPAAMSASAPVITKQTDIWRMWIGFNVSHSMGLMLFGLVYGYLALAHGDLLFESLFLLGVGFAMLLGFVFLARRYWFITPLLGSGTALVLYVASVAWAWA